MLVSYAHEQHVFHSELPALASVETDSIACIFIVDMDGASLQGRVMLSREAWQEIRAGRL